MHPVSSFIQSKRSLFSKFSPFYPHKTDAHKVCFQKPGEWVIKISENVKKTRVRTFSLFSLDFARMQVYILKNNKRLSVCLPQNGETMIPPGDCEQRDERIRRLEAISLLPMDEIIGIRVKDIITEVTEFDRNQLEDDTRLVEDIGFDWDDEVDGEELSMSLEEEFGIGISANELVEMETVLDLINFIKAKKANG